MWRAAVQNRDNRNSWQSLNTHSMGPKRFPRFPAHDPDSHNYRDCFEAAISSSAIPGMLVDTGMLPTVHSDRSSVSTFHSVLSKQQKFIHMCSRPDFSDDPVPDQNAKLTRRSENQSEVMRVVRDVLLRNVLMCRNNVEFACNMKPELQSQKLMVTVSQSKTINHHFRTSWVSRSLSCRKSEWMWIQSANFHWNYPHGRLSEAGFQFELQSDPRLVMRPESWEEHIWLLSVLTACKSFPNPCFILMLDGKKRIEQITFESQDNACWSGSTSIREN